MYLVTKYFFANMHVYIVNTDISYTQQFNSVFHHDHQEKESFYRCYDSDMASRDIEFHIGFGASSERAAKGKR